MNETASTMKKEIRMIAGYRALIISKYFLSLLLGLITLYLAQKNYAASSLYVLLILDILPGILIYALNDYAKKTDKRIIKALTEDIEFKLKHLKSKYKFTRLSYFANTVSYLLSLLLICLWQLNYSRTMYLHPVLINAPLIIMASGLIVRFLGYILYRFKIPYALSHNKL